MAQPSAGLLLTVDFTFDADGRLASVTDPLLRVESYEYDDAGRLFRTTLPDNRVVVYGYDANGNLTSLTPPGQPAHVFRYTLLDQEREYDPPSVGAGDPRTFYTYDLDRQLKQIDRPDGGSIVMGYDTAGRVSTVTLPRGTVTHGYSATTGQLTSLTAPGGEGLAFTHDGMLPTGTTWSGTAAGSVSHGYDADFRVSSQSVNGAHTAAFTHDDDGLLTQAGALALGRDAQTGLLASTSLGTVATSLGHNGFGEVTSETATVGGSSLYATTFTRDLLGRITQKVETIQGSTTTFDYLYDPAGRLEHVKVNGTLVRTYAYDPNGNRLSVVDAATGTTTGSYDAQDRIATYGTLAYTHDAAGDLVSKTDTATSATTLHTYDALGNLTQVALPDGRNLTYAIDAQNRRVGKRIDGTLVQGFLYQDPLNPVAELDGAGNVVARFVYGEKPNVPAYVVKGSTTYRILSDHLGSVRLVVDASTGTVAQRIDYDECGNITADSSPGFQPFGFAGGIYDPDTGLTRFGARDYDPVVGRWTTKDPIRFDGGLNLYGYTFNDPINFIDPNGKFITVVIGVAVGGLTSASAAANAGLTGADFYLAVGAGMALGALSGGASSLATTTLGKFAANTFAGGLTGGLADATIQGLDDSRCFDSGSVLNSALTGAVLGAISSAAQATFAGALPKASNAASTFGATTSGSAALHLSTTAPPPRPIPVR